MTDALFAPALRAFLQSQREQLLTDLIGLVRQPERQTMKEAYLAGQVEAYEGLFRELEKFAASELAAAQGA